MTIFQAKPLAVLVLAACAAGHVSAATIVQDQPFDYLSNSNTNVSFSQFDPAKGTLTDVSLALLSSSITLTSTVALTNAPGAGYQVLSRGASVLYAYLTGLADLNPNEPSPVGPTCSTGSTGKCSDTASSNATGAVNSPAFPTPLAAFLLPLPAPNFPVRFAVQTNGYQVFDPTGNLIDGSTVGLQTSASGEWTGTWQLTYTYTAVPEPATWALAVVGFGGVAFVMRRSSRSRPAPA